MSVWFITGCSSGLGRGIAKAALEAGEKVVMTARNTEELELLAKEYPDTALPLFLDLNDEATMKRAFGRAMQSFGDIDILVNNAGHGYRATVEESSDDKIKELFETNFFAPAKLIQMVLPSMREKKSGLIVNITSIGAVRGALGNGFYSASKGALELLTEALSLEVGPLGIQTMLVEPGAIKTGFYGKRMEGEAKQIDDYDFIAEKYRKEYINPEASKNGDPALGGQAIVDTILSGDIPEHLLLGSDAVKAATFTYTERLKQIEKWKNISAKADAK